MSECGVFSRDDNKPLRLDCCEISITLQTCAASIVMRQEYKNIALRPTLVEYRFPVPRSWVVTAVSLEVDKEIQHSEMQQRVTPDRGTDVPDVLSVLVPWTVSPSHTCIVFVTCLVPLWSPAKSYEPQMTLTLPSSLVPTTNPDAYIMTDWRQNFTLQNSESLNNGFIVTLNGTLLRTIESAEVKCEGFNVVKNSVTKSSGGQNSVTGGLVDIRLENRSPQISPRHVEFTFKMDCTQNKDILQALVMKDPNAKCIDDQNIVVIAVTPPAVPVNTEVIFLVDCSGSMEPHMSALRRSLALSILSLPAATHFNILCFGSTQKWFNPGGSVQRDDNMTACFGFVQGLTADMGKTELFKALQRVYETPALQGYSRQIVVITDGRDEKFGGRVLQLVASNPHSTRVHAVGLGKYVDYIFHEEMVASSGGQARICDTDDTLCSTLVGLLPEILRPALAQVSVAFTREGVEDSLLLRPTRAYNQLMFNPSRTILTYFAPPDLGDHVIVTLTCQVQTNAWNIAHF